MSRQLEAVRFWGRVDQTAGPHGCWPWLGERNKLRGGYGYFHTDARKRVIASRYAYGAIHGPFPAELCVLHRCDNPPCVNPAHLFVGTNADNVADMMAKGRHKTPRNPPPRRTHCPKGHPYSAGNLVKTKGGRHQCKTCHRDRQSVMYHLRRMAYVLQHGTRLRREIAAYQARLVLAGTPQRIARFQAAIRRREQWLRGEFVR